MSSVQDKSRRKQDRTRAVLPVRVRGKDASGAQFDELAHTLDITPSGMRLGAIRRELKALDRVIVLYHQRRIEFTVMWTKLVGKHGEYQVGLQMVAQEQQRNDPWGLNLAHAGTPPASRVSAVSGAA